MRFGVFLFIGCVDLSGLHRDLGFVCFPFTWEGWVRLRLSIQCAAAVCLTFILLFLVALVGLR